ncbi:signal recognition particle-docking protein FtsY [Alteromonas pelagimontana]|uniref:Signal recognition particle receptor FtsY n=1 Tax=Alteromonas pelagimontana TaxID=1858656 RepID=A0A6M4MFP8_9ALTE|nr:signal recognition particle-docking protein FtsY [Alteromonas pelagimontana]QJR81445.1 signal recognition particle-docking protein FtsY [Alteromonas pelagimontana]
MSKLFGWFSKNKHSDKEKGKQSQTPVPKEESRSQQPEPVPSDLKQVEEVDAPAENSQPVITPPNETAEPEKKVAETAELATASTVEIKTQTDAAIAFEQDEKPDLPDTNAPAVEAEAVVEEIAPRHNEDDADEVIPPAEKQAGHAVTAPVKAPVTEKRSLFSRLKASLSRTRMNLGSGFVSLFRGKAIDDDLYEELETQLLVADVGMNTTQKIITRLTESAKRSQLKDAEALLDILKEQMREMLNQVDKPLPGEIANHDAANGPYVILMVGVNGVGKTTTIGKLAKQLQQDGKKVMLAAGDTFRAAAVEQLQVWGERNLIPVIAQPTGSDSASVLFDALEAAKSRKIDVLIADTAGRLQNKNNLMEELKKVLRVMKKISPTAPHEVMLTLDAGTGQNAISQAKLFNEAVGLTGITLTKLDGTAKGGVIFSIADQFAIPIRYIGVGEGIDDLRTFNADEFIDALFSETENRVS